MGCSSGAPDAATDAAPDPGDHRADASIGPSDGDSDGAPGSAADGDDAPRALVILPAQFVEEDMPMRMLGEGDPIDLWAAPQGGHVVLVAAKVKYFQGDTAILRVRVRYPDTPFIVAEEARTMKMVPVPGEPDTMQPDLHTRTQVAHVPLCPDYDPMDIVNRPLEFVVQVTSSTGEVRQSGDATLQLYPSCAASVAGKAFCQCECSANYVLGKCPRDAGMSD
jgi:hypothetical protein